MGGGTRSQRSKVHSESKHPSSLSLMGMTELGGKTRSSPPSMILEMESPVEGHSFTSGESLTNLLDSNGPAPIKRKKIRGHGSYSDLPRATRSIHSNGNAKSRTLTAGTFPARLMRAWDEIAPERRVIYRVWITMLMIFTILRVYISFPTFLGRRTAERIYPVANHAGFSLEFFAAPKPFIGIDRENQIRALESWLALEPKPRVTFLGYEEGYDEMARTYGVRIDPNVDRNFLGVPLFNSIFYRANWTVSQGRNSIAVLVNSDILIFDDFVYTLRKVVHDYRDWMVIGARWDVEEIPPRETNDFVAYRTLLVNHVRRNGTLHTYGGIDLWAWNSPGPPLMNTIMPHFAYGRGKYDNWMTHEAIASNQRAVVDISEACTLAHLKHDYHLVSGASDRSVISKTGLHHSFWNEEKHRKIELYLNILLAETSGTYRNQQGTILHATFKVGSCYEWTGLCNFYRKRPHRCRCEYSPLVPSAQNDPYAVGDSRTIFCGLQSAPEGDEEGVEANRESLRLSGKIEAKGNDDADGAKVQVDPTPVFGFPFTAHSLLEVIAPKKRVILTSGKWSDRYLILNLLCVLRRLKAGPILLAAEDDLMYDFAVTRGIPAFLEYDEDAPDPRIGELAFRAIRRVSGLGYSVIYSAPSVLWKRNPLEIADWDTFDLGLIGTAATNNASEDIERHCKVVLASGSVAPRVLDDTLKGFRAGALGSPCQSLASIACGPYRELKVSPERCTKPDGSLQTILFPDSTVMETGEDPFRLWSNPRRPLSTVASSTFALAINHAGFESKSLQDQIEELRTKEGLFVNSIHDLCIYD